MNDFKVGDEVTCIRVYDSEGMLTLGDWIVRKVHPWGDSIEVQGIDGICCWFANQFQHKIKDEDVNDMIEFDLDRALAGDKVITRDGGKVTQFNIFYAEHGPMLYGYDVNSDKIESWETDGRYFDVPRECDSDLFMAPKHLTGFVNVYPDYAVWFETKVIAESSVGTNLIACIDLSTHNEGEGL